MSALTRLVAALRTLFSWCAEISAIVIFIMVLLVTADVFGRYVLSKPIPGTYEVTEFLMVIIVFLAYAHTEATGQNIRIQLIEKYISPRHKYPLDALACFLGMLIFGVICWQAAQQAWLAVEIGQRTSGLVRLPLWPAKWVLVVGSFLLLLQFFIGFVANIAHIFGRSAA